MRCGIFSMVLELVLLCFIRDRYSQPSWALYPILQLSQDIAPTRRSSTNNCDTELDSLRYFA